MLATTMISSVTEHYANHLAPIYSWMVGDFDIACSQANGFYSDISLPDGNGSVAVDLGCGHGLHSIAIGRRGYRVLAIDTSAHLLSELNGRIGELPIQTIDADLTKFVDHLGSGSATVIACMGDTLTHLPSEEAVNSLILDAARSLVPDGWLTLSFRDYSHELIGAERFIPVRSDDQRIHTCFLEYRTDTVVVHDIVHTRVDSAWQTSVSAYQKLRLQPDILVAAAESNGFSLIHKQTVRGMLYLAFRRTGATIEG